MKYMLLIYNNPASMQALSEAELSEIYAEVDTLIKELSATGEWLGGQGLVDAMHTKTVRVRDGVPMITDGPYIEAKEQMAGYCMVECDSIERAAEIAARWPDARSWAMEVRQLLDPGGTEL